MFEEKEGGSTWLILAVIFSGNFLHQSFYYSETIASLLLRGRFFFTSQI